MAKELDEANAAQLAASMILATPQGQALAASMATTLVEGTAAAWRPAVPPWQRQRPSR